MSVKVVLCCGHVQLNFRRGDKPEEVAVRLVMGHLPGEEIAYEVQHVDGSPIRALTYEESIKMQHALRVLASLIGEIK